MNTQKLWDLIKTTLIEKDGSNTTYGSIKRWGAWILFFFAGLIIIAGLLPGGSFHIGTIIQMSWHHCPINRDVLADILKAIGTYILGGQALTQVTNTIQNYHNVKNPGTPDKPTNG